MIFSSRLRQGIPYSKPGGKGVGVFFIDADDGGLVEVTGANQPVVPMLIAIQSREYNIEMERDEGRVDGKAQNLAVPYCSLTYPGSCNVSSPDLCRDGTGGFQEVGLTLAAGEETVTDLANSLSGVCGFVS